jgi:hypothetical protein
MMLVGCGERKRSEIIENEARRKTRAINLKQLNMNFLSLSIVMPFRSEEKLAATFHPVFRLPVNIYAAAQDWKIFHRRVRPVPAVGS